MLAAPNSKKLICTVLFAAMALTGCIQDRNTATQDEPEADAMAMADATSSIDGGAVERDAGQVVEVDMASPVVPRACGNEDSLAPNQQLDSAAEIELGFTRDDLFICPETEDWFVLTLREGQRAQLTLDADPVETDLDLAILDVDGMVVAESATEDGAERLDFDAPADGQYYLRVDGYLDQAAFYKLSVSGTCVLDSQCPDGQVCDRFDGACEQRPESDCGDDQYEPNDTDDQASPLEVPSDSVTGTICAADRDWFAFEAADGDSFELLVGFDGGEDIDIHVINAETGAVISRATSDRRTNPERLTFSHLPAGNYRIGLTLFVPEDESDRDAAYTIDLVGSSGRCEADRDCTAAGLPICDEGLCVAPQPQAALGERCGRNEDCAEGADLCFTGGQGGHDNFCTIGCTGRGQCGALGETAYCQPVSRNAAVCIPGCDSDDDCGRFFGCTDGVCQIRGACRVDEDCGEGEVCASARTGERYCALPSGDVACGVDAENEPNNSRNEATRIAFDEVYGGLLICNGDDDWYRLAVPANQASWSMSITASFRAGVDIDIYLYDAFGNLVGSATAPDEVNEVIELRFVAPGSYFLRVDQFDSDRLVDTEYDLVARINDNDDRCTVDAGQCGRTDPLRAFCDEETGACSAIEGEGQVELGQPCDSNDDCSDNAEFCWTFRFQDGSLPNICTIQCGADSDCGGIPGTVCQRFRRFGACLPPN